MEEVQRLFLIGPRTCGKSTVAKALGETLTGWQILDLDFEFKIRCTEPGQPQYQVDGQEYYEGSLALLKEFLKRERFIMAVGGGTFTNSRFASAGCFKTIQECKESAKIVLLLPPRFHFKNRSILYERESSRILSATKQVVSDNYDARIDFFRNHADRILYGTNAAGCARKIISVYGLEPEYA